MFARGAYAGASEKFQRASLMCPTDAKVSLYVDMGVLVLHVRTPLGLYIYAYTCLTYLWLYVYA